MRRRPLQAVTIVLLATLVTTCVVFAPLYSRAMLQALAHLDLQHTSTAARGLKLTSLALDPGDGEARRPPRSTQRLASVLPGSARRYYGKPIPGLTAQVVGDAQGARTDGLLQWRQDQCRYLVLAQGRCPTASLELAVSRADARIYRLHVGQQLPLEGMATVGRHRTVPTVTFTVVGVYEQRDRAGYWMGSSLTGLSGVPEQDPPYLSQHDTWLTSRATFADPALPTLAVEQSHVDFRLRVSRVRTDELLALDGTLSRLKHQARSDQRLLDVRFYTALPDLAADVRHQRAQSQVIVSLLMVQLALLGVVVLWLVLGTTVDQRRPEVAVSMLRGRGRRGALALLLSELLPLTVTGVPLGLASALLLSWVARVALLPGDAPFEFGVGAWSVAFSALLVLALVTVLASAGATREPVDRLLRRIPVRRPGWSVGAVEAGVVAASTTAVVALVSGGLRGPIALAAPLLLALVVGLVLARATSPGTAWLGRCHLDRGRLGVGVSLLDAARTPATRRIVAVVTIVSALLVFAASALSVGARNRDLAAEQVAGARVTVPVIGNQLVAVRKALATVDPRGADVTPVVFIDPPAKGSQETVAGVPSQLRRIALFSGQRKHRPTLASLTPPRAAPIRLRGDRLSVTITTRDLQVRSQQTDATAQLQLAVVYPDDEAGTVSLGTLPTGAGKNSRTATAILHCEAGCNLTGISVLTDPGSSVRGGLELSSLTTSVSGAPTPVPLGPAAQWTRLQDPRLGTMLPTSPDPRSLFVNVATAAASRTTMTQKWVPQYLPAEVVGRLPEGELGPAFTATGIDGQDRAARVSARLPRIPRAGARAALVNLDVLMRGTSIVEPRARIELWFRHDDPVLEHRVSTALQRVGSGLGTPLTLTEVRRRYDDSTSAWSLDLAAVVGVAAFLLGLLVVIVLAATTWRIRARDLAALQLSGVRASTARSAATMAQLPSVLVAVVAGTASGLVGLRLTLSRVPLFARAPAVSTLDLGIPWVAAAAVALAALVLLLTTAWLAGATIASRADLQRVREQL